MISGASYIKWKSIYSYINIKIMKIQLNDKGEIFTSLCISKNICMECLMNSIMWLKLESKKRDLVRCFTIGLKKEQCLTTIHSLELLAIKVCHPRHWSMTGEKGILIHCTSKCKRIQPLWRTDCKGIFEKLNADLLYDLAISLHGIYSMEIKPYAHA